MNDQEPKTTEEKTTKLEIKNDGKTKTIPLDGSTHKIP